MGHNKAQRLSNEGGRFHVVPIDLPPIHRSSLVHGLSAVPHVGFCNTTGVSLAGSQAPWGPSSQ